MFKSNVKDVFKRAGIEDEISEFKKFLYEYNSRYIKIIKPQKYRPKRLLGQNGLHYIQLALNRSKALFDGSVAALNINNGLLAILSARAHLEVTGGIAYLYKKLKQFYDGVITYEQLDESIHRLTLGARINDIYRAPEPINVMTLIDAVDYYFKDKIPKKVSMFRESYDFLSEFCHPNSYGITMGCKINSVAIVRYNQQLLLTEMDLCFVHYLLMSCSAFFDFYSLIYDLLNRNEELPIIIIK